MTNSGPICWKGLSFKRKKYHLEGFHDTEASVRKTVAAVKNHPLMPKDVLVRGFIIDSVTGALAEVR